MTETVLITDEEVEALRSIQAKIKAVNVACGWYSKPRTFGEGIALIHSEISEALEGGRKGLNDDHLPERPMAEVEFADAVIRILDEGARQDFDVAGALAEKFVYNQSRDDHKPENRAKEGGKKF
jgi:hypothetical protein